MENSMKIINIFVEPIPKWHPGQIMVQFFATRGELTPWLDITYLGYKIRQMAFWSDNSPEFKDSGKQG